MLRQESGFALLAAMVNRGLGGRAEMADFMPWAKDDTQPELGDVMNMLTGGKRG